MKAPIKGQRGTYHRFNGRYPNGMMKVDPNPRDEFTVVRVDGDICYAIYDKDPLAKVSCFIWRYASGLQLNELHNWPDKYEMSDAEYEDELRSKCSRT